MSERMHWAKEGVDRQSLSLSLRRCKESVHAVPGTKTQHCGPHVCCCEVLPCSWVHIRLSNRTRVRQSQTDCLVAVTKATRQMKRFSGSWFEGKVDHGGESMGPGKGRQSRCVHRREMKRDSGVQPVSPLCSVQDTTPWTVPHTFRGGLYTSTNPLQKTPHRQVLFPW